MEVQGDPGGSEEIKGDPRKSREIQGDSRRSREIQRDPGRSGEIQGDPGRSSRLGILFQSAAEPVGNKGFVFLRHVTLWHAMSSIANMPTERTARSGSVQRRRYTLQGM